VAGTFERLLLSPFGPVLATIAMTLFPMMRALLMAIWTLALAALIFGLDLRWTTAALAVPVGLLCALTFAAIAVAVAAAVVAFKRAPGIGFVLAGIALVSGVYFPVGEPPGWIEWLSEVQPYRRCCSPTGAELCSSTEPAPRRVRLPGVADPSIFKAYDIRGLYPDQMDEQLAYRIGRAFPRVLAELQDTRVEEQRIAVGRDMRTSAPSMSEQYIRGIADAGADVLDIGMVGTEMLYWTVGARELDGGLMCTASHNPKEYTGAKLVKRGALALSGDSGIGELRELVGDREPGPPADRPGDVTTEDIGDLFRKDALGYIDPKAIKPMKVMLDGANGMAGQMVGPILNGFPLDQHPFYWDPDGNFPDHEPNPLIERNRRFIIDKVRETGADLGIAWDGDADRCFFIDDTDQFVAGDFLTALLAESILRKDPGAAILYDVRASRAVPDTVEREGGHPYINRVGHAFFKTRMRELGAAFGGEVSGHYYFHDFYCADSGTIPALLVLELLSIEGKKLSELLEPLRSRYFISGEINSEVDDQEGKMKELEERYWDGAVSHLDGVSVDYDDWHFNVRPSNTEPLLRLNLESLVSQEHMQERRDEVLGLIRA
jgi:phosphomannomutase